jgi:hypothetical protein
MAIISPLGVSSWARRHPGAMSAKLSTDIRLLAGGHELIASDAIRPIGPNAIVVRGTHRRTVRVHSRRAQKRSVGAGQTEEWIDVGVIGVARGGAHLGAR